MVLVFANIFYLLCNKFKVRNRLGNCDYVVMARLGKKNGAQKFSQCKIVNTSSATMQYRSRIYALVSKVSKEDVKQRVKNFRCKFQSFG